MSLHEFKAGNFGAIQTHSLAVSFAFSKDAMSRLYTRYGDGKTIHEEKILWRDVQLSDRDIYLTDIHEMDHFAQLVSTPAGVLIWRLYLVLSGDVSWLGGTYKENGVEMNCRGFPVVEWHRSQGRSSLASALRNQQDGKVRLAYIDQEVVAGIEAVERLLDILTCQKPWIKFANYTVGEFLDLLNFVFPYLSRRCMIPWQAVWKTRLNKDERLFPNAECAVNLRGILEVIAYAKEQRALNKMRATPDELIEWERSRVPAEFLPPFRFFLDSLGSPSATRGFLSKTLIGRIDICAHAGIPEELFVEDEWPWWQSRKSVDDFGPLIANALVSLHNLSSRPNLYGPGSWESRRDEPVKDGFSRVPGLEAVYFGHLKRLDQAFIRSTKKNLGGLMETIQGRPSTIQNEVLEELLLIEYQDVMLFYQPKTFISEMLGAALFSMLVCLGANVARGTLMQPPEPTGAKLAKSIEELTRKFKEAGALGTEQSGEVCEGVRQMYTKQMFERFVCGTNVLWDT